MLTTRPRQTWQVQIARSQEWLKVRAGRGARLDVGDVRALAGAVTGLRDAGDPYHEDGLRRLLASAKTSDLTAVGRRTIFDMSWQGLARRLRLEDAKARSPQAFEGTLRPLFLVTGAARSGTTHLHRLLAVDERFRGIPTWELNDPFPPTDGGPDVRRELAWRRHEVAKAGPAHIHYTDPDTPEECTILQTGQFSTAVYWGIAPVWDYAEWVLGIGTDLDDKLYAEHRAYMSWFQAQHPDTSLAIKSPDHMARLTTVDRVLPEAMIVNTVRDPVAIANSTHSLVYQAHRLSARRLDVIGMTAMNLRMLDEEWRLHIDSRAHLAGKVVDVYYDDLVHQPVDVVRSIYDFHGVDWPDGHGERLRAYLDANPRNRFGEHAYRSEDFGLTDRELRLRFRDYIDHFGLA